MFKSYLFLNTEDIIIKLINILYALIKQHGVNEFMLLWP